MGLGVFGIVLLGAGVGVSYPYGDIHDSRRRFGAMLIAALPFFPPVAALITLAVFFSVPTENGLWCLLFGFPAALDLWFLSAYVLRFYAGAPYANRTSFDLVNQQFTQLGFGIDSEQHIEPPIAPRSPPSVEITNQARSAQSDARRSGLQWVLATGYTLLWRRLHRAQEASIAAQPDSEVLATAQYEYDRLENSKISQRSELQLTIQALIKVIQPKGMELPVAGAGVRPLTTGAGIPAAPAAAGGGTPPTPGEAGGSALPLTPEAVRSTLQIISRTINEYRDEGFNGLIVARNRLWMTMFLSGLLTFSLLALAILRETSRDAMTGAAAVFLAGGLAGLINRLRDDAEVDTAIDDYGLSTARLFSVPLISGLAALAGVILAQRELAPSQTVATVSSVFCGALSIASLTFAVVAGLVPSSIFNRLRQKTEESKQALKSSESSH